ncbi:hypothetical protein [Lutibacter sp.]
MKTIFKVFGGTLLLLLLSISIVSCSAKKEVYTDVANANVITKSGAQLWGETCNRCHIAPSPSAYNDVDWNTIALHMRVRANLTESEITKILEFLKSAN